jgi:hypothetical protein
MALVAVRRAVPPAFNATSTVRGSTSLPRPSTTVAPLLFKRPRTPPVSFLTMPPFHSCIFSTSTSTGPTLMPWPPM